ncbi:hypothetical protein [Haloarcula sp. JP-L23]|uniref:hypothetical protein n=1 Tax=Haloarcula sp. JP-L23 TaxID=2716717 RepID=UPI00140F3D8E|nr:hypothetical protein G9465_25240 [Haloarcula sp. JP-L23]
MASVAILPLDQASIVVPVPDTPDIVLKHTDGELVRIQESEDGSVTVDRRHENAVTWYEAGKYGSLEDAVVAATDMQAFAVRRGGEPSSLLEAGVTGSLPGSVLEIVPLDLGGIVVDDRSHLPLVFHLITGEYWRISTLPGDEYTDYQLEYREDDVASWETVSKHDGVDATVDVLPAFLDETGIEYTTDASASGMSDTIETHGPSFVEEVPDDVPEDVSDIAGIQKRRLNWEN